METLEGLDHELPPIGEETALIPLEEGESRCNRACGRIWTWVRGTPRDSMALCRGALLCCAIPLVGIGLPALTFGLYSALARHNPGPLWTMVSVLVISLGIFGSIGCMLGAQS